MDYCAPPVECTTGPLVIEIPTEPGVEVPTHPVTELPNTGSDGSMGILGVLLLMAGAIIIIIRNRVRGRFA